jgi:hypothetical protein
MERIVSGYVATHFLFDKALIVTNCRGCTWPLVTKYAVQNNKTLIQILSEHPACIILTSRMFGRLMADDDLF